MVQVRDARVLVTGATGFIGSHLTRRLVAEGADVHALTSQVSSVYPRRLLDLQAQITMHAANVVDRSAMDELVRAVRPQVVFHLAAYSHVGKSWERVDECIQSNIQGTVNLLQALGDVGFDRFIYTGTSDIYGDIDVPFREDAKVMPRSPYSVSKYAAEHYCRIFQQARQSAIVMVRPFPAYGPAQSPDRIIPETIVRALRKQELKMTSGRQTREFNYVEDVAEGFVTIAAAPDVDGEIINLGTAEEIAIRDVVTVILNIMGDPIAPKFGALPDRPNEIWRMVCENTKVTKLGWKPQHSLRAGLEKTVAWYRGEVERDGSSFEA